MSTLMATPEPTNVPPASSGPNGSVPIPASSPSPPLKRKPQYRTLKPERIVVTAEQLSQRIGERFPQAGLKAVADEVWTVAMEAARTCRRIGRPIYFLRFIVFVLGAGLLGVLIAVGFRVNWLADQELFEVEHFITTLEAGLGATFFLGAIGAFLVTYEKRVKRERLLVAMHELRALAHIVDMHQLTKDPESIHQHIPTKSSPKRFESTFLLGRYLDYCSELLSLISKIGALYVQEFPDPQALVAADQLSTLTNGLSRNIWQKIMILDRAVDLNPASPPLPTPPRPN